MSDAETWRLLRKAGWDSVPAVRCAVLECLWEGERSPEMSEGAHNGREDVDEVEFWADRAREAQS